MNDKNNHNEINRKTLLENEVKELYKLIFEKENEIIEIDKKLALFSDITILDNKSLDTLINIFWGLLNFKERNDFISIHVIL